MQGLTQVGVQVYDPQIGAALDAIASDNLEEFKLAMLTIHQGEEVWRSGTVAVQARQNLKLSNPRAAAMLPVSLSR